MCVCDMQPKEKQTQRDGSLAGKENQQRKTEKEPQVGTDTDTEGVKGARGGNERQRAKAENNSTEKGWRTRQRKGEARGAGPASFPEVRNAL